MQGLLFSQGVQYTSDVLPAGETCSNRCIAGRSIFAVLRRGKFDDAQLSTFLEHLPPQLQVLRALARMSDVAPRFEVPVQACLNLNHVKL